MAYTLTLKDCSDSTPLNGVTVGNGNCYTNNGGVYTFATCDDIAACAGKNSLGITVSPSTLPAAGGNATFTISHYGHSGQISLTKSKTGTGGSSWSGTASIAGSVCPTTSTVSLTASENETTDQVIYKLSYGSSASATVTQAAGEAPVHVYSVSFPAHLNFKATATDHWDVSVSISSFESPGSQHAIASYTEPCSNIGEGRMIPNTGSDLGGNGTYVYISVNLLHGSAVTSDCVDSDDVQGKIRINVNGVQKEFNFTNGTAGIEIDLTDNTTLDEFYVTAEF